MILAIDPGNEYSAYVIWDGQKVHSKGKLENRKLLILLAEFHLQVELLVIEMISMQGNMVGATVFDTCRWIGIFQREWEHHTDKPVELIKRIFIKSHYKIKKKNKHGIEKDYCCVNDTDIIKALTVRFGEKGTKKERNQNPITYGMARDIWQAFALAVYWIDNNQLLIN